MSEQRTPIGKFIHTSWINLNIRAGKYRHLQTIKKCRSYQYIEIEFNRVEFSTWCKERQSDILSLARPSVDRKDSTKNYSLDNIQIIELSANIRKDKTVFVDGQGTCFRCHKIKSEAEFVVDKRRANGRTSVCLSCERIRTKEKNNRLGRLILQG